MHRVGSISRTFRSRSRSLSLTKTLPSFFSKYGSFRRGSLPIPSTNFDKQHEMEGDYIPLIEENLSPSNPKFPSILQPAYVISIRPERMNNFVSRLGPWSVHCKRGKCIYGKVLNKHDLLSKKILARSWAKARMGQIGCFCSHYNAWESISKSPYEYGTIFEDDVDLRYSNAVQIADKIQNAMKELEDKKIDWDILYWNINPTPSITSNLQNCGLEHWKKVPLNNCMGCIAYTVKKNLLPDLLRRAKPFNTPVDYWLMRQFDKIKTYCINPPFGSVVVTASDTEDRLSPTYEKDLKNYKKIY